MSFFEKLARCRDENGRMDYDAFWELVITELKLNIPRPPPLSKALAQLEFTNPIVFNGCFRWQPRCLVVQGDGTLSKEIMEGHVPLREVIKQAAEHIPLDVPHPGSPVESEHAWATLLETHGFRVHIDDQWVYPPIETDIPYGYYVVDLHMGEEFKGLSSEDARKAIHAKKATPLRAIEGLQFVAMNLDILHQEAHRQPMGFPGKILMWFLGSECPNWHGSGDEFMLSYLSLTPHQVEQMEYSREKRTCWGGISVHYQCACHPDPDPNLPYFTSLAKL